MMKEVFDVGDTKMDKLLREYKEDWSSMDQRLTSLEQDARQPCLAMEADGLVNTKTRERTEGAAIAVQAIHGDSCTAQKVRDRPKTSTSFGMMTEPPDLPCREGVLVENGDASPKSCLPSLEMRSPSAAGGLLRAGDTSTATRTTFNKSPLRLYATVEANPKETYIWTSVSSAWYDSSFWRNKLLATPSCLAVIEAKSMQNITFDPGGSQGHPCACPIL